MHTGKVPLCGSNFPERGRLLARSARQRMRSMDLSQSWSLSMKMSSSNSVNLTMTKKLFSIIAVGVCAVVTSYAADNWPQFRGLNASGISGSAQPPTEFAPGTNQLWKTSVPPGMSSPCV